MVESILKVENLCREIPSAGKMFALIADVSLEIKRGEFVSIVGPSGSGKSSLLYLLGLLDIPTRGKISLAGVDASLLSEEARADLRLANIGFVFQFHFLLPELSALENVMLPMKRLGKLSEPKIKERAEMLLLQLGLKEEISKKPKQLSGGQSQRVAIGRALANEPALILADEPTGNLDSHSSSNVRGIFRSLSDSKNCAIVTVTHDPRFEEETDRSIRIVDGRIVTKAQLEESERAI